MATTKILTDTTLIYKTHLFIYILMICNYCTAVINVENVRGCSTH